MNAVKRLQYTEKTNDPDGALTFESPKYRKNLTAKIPHLFWWYVIYTQFIIPFCRFRCCWKRVQ